MSQPDRARALLDRIPWEKSQLRQRLLMAAAITSVMQRAPTVVGGTAEEYWAGGEYHPTDLDLCPEPTDEDIRALRLIGLRRVGRHWVRDDLPVAVEFPGPGDDIERTTQVTVNGVRVSIIGCEDLYLNRVRQATVGWPHEDISFDAAFEVAVTNFATMDWRYVRNRITRAIASEPAVGSAMAAIDSRIRRRARQASLTARSLGRRQRAQGSR